MSAVVNYAATPINGGGVLALASTSRTVPANPLVLFDPGVNGGQCHRITAAPLGDVIQTSLRIFKYDGAAYHFLFSMQIGAQVLTGNIAEVCYTYQAVDNENLFPIQLQAGWTLRAAMNDAQAGGGLSVMSEGGGY